MPFEIFQSEKNEKYYFRLKAKNGEPILQSEAYDQKAGAQNGVESVKKNATEDKFEKREAKDGRHYFVLKAGNGQIIGKSQMYKSISGINNGIKSVISNAEEGDIKDLTEA